MPMKPAHFFWLMPLWFPSFQMLRWSEQFHTFWVPLLKCSYNQAQCGSFEEPETMWVPRSKYPTRTVISFWNNSCHTKCQLNLSILVFFFFWMVQYNRNELKSTKIATAQKETKMSTKTSRQATRNLRKQRPLNQPLRRWLHPSNYIR